jgi:hypothetical protein
VDDKDRLGETLDFDTFLVDRLKKRASSGRPSKVDSPLKSYILVQGTVFLPFWPRIQFYSFLATTPILGCQFGTMFGKRCAPSATIHSQLIALNRVQNAGWNNSFSIGTKLAVIRFYISMFCQKSNTTNE